MPKIQKQKQSTRASHIAQFSKTLERLEDAKRRSFEYADLLEAAGCPRYAQRVRECSDFLTFTDSEPGGQNPKGAPTRYCRVRGCPICERARCIRLYARQIDTLVKEAQKRRKFLLLTLTVQNQPVDKLRAELVLLSGGFRILTRRLMFKRACIGWIRSIEVTKGIGNMAHPHIHALLVVSPEYFRGSKDLYISQEEWQSLWKAAANLPYSPVVDVRRLRGRIQKSLHEVLKYTTKPSDLMASKDWMALYLSGVARIRLFAAGGSLRLSLRKVDAEFKCRPKRTSGPDEKEPPIFRYSPTRKVYCPFNPEARSLLLRRGKP